MVGGGVQGLSLQPNHALHPVASPPPEAKSRFLSGLDREILPRRNLKGDSIMKCFLKLARHPGFNPQPSKDKSIK